MLKINPITKINRLLSALKMVVMIIIIFITLSLNVRAALNKYYVGGTGASDNNPGTSSHPFKTIQKAASVAVAGDMINIRTGTYRETVVPANSGTSGKPIIYQPDGDAVVTVSGTDIADGGWSLHTGNIYKKTISMTNGYNSQMTDNTTLMANQVFVNGEMMIEARWPNLPNSDDLFNRNDFRDGTLGTWSTSESQILTDSGIPDIQGGWTGGTIWVNGWFITQTRMITAYSSGQIAMTGDVIAPKFRKYYYLTGRLGALDAEKEFFYDGAQLYLWQPGGGSPSKVEVKKRNYAFDLSGKSNITVRKINLFAASIISDEESMNITLDELNAIYINHNITVEGEDLVYCHTGQTITDKGAAGIRLMGPGSIIKNSEVAFSSNMGIMLGNNCTAYNNKVHDIGYDGTYACAIAPAMGTNGQTITNNSMYRVGRSCIDLTNSQNVNIGYNDMYHFGMLNVDMGAIYSCRGYNQTGTRIHHNWIHDSKSIAHGEGIQTGLYFDQGSGPVQVDHNVLWNNLVGDYYVEHTTTAVSCIFNNTFASTDIHLSYKNYPHEPRIYDILKNNIFREEFQITWIPETPEGTNSLYLTEDPLFLNDGTGGLKYRLQENSPAIDKGSVIPGVTDGFMGNAPDIGAYEYGGLDWIPGYTVPVEMVQNSEKTK